MRRLASCLAFLSLLVLVGCGSSGPSHRYYVLAPPVSGDVAFGASTAEPANETSAETLRVGVETFAVDPPYDQPRLVYRIGRDAGEVGFYDHHRWAAPPGRLVTTGLVAGLQGLTLADGRTLGVEPASVTGRYDLVLTGRVVALEEVDLPGDRHVARLVVDLELHDAHSDEILWADTLAAEVEDRAESAAGIMGQIREAFADLVAAVRAGVGTALESTPDSAPASS